MDVRWLAGAVLALVGAGPAAANTGPEGPTFTVVDLPGTPAEASTDARSPTVLTAGTWKDSLGAGGGDNNTHYFVYRRAIADSTVHVGVVASATESSDQLAVDVGTAADATTEAADCGSDTGDSSYSSPYAVFGAAVEVGPDSLGDRNAVCLKAGELRIAVTRTNQSFVNDLPFSLRVVEEAPDTGAGVPEAVEVAKVRAPEVDDAGESQGSTSLDDAPLLEPGRYTATVAEGEQRLWRVRLDWGQQLSVRAVVPQPDAAAAEALDFATPVVELTMLDPRFATLGAVVEDYTVSTYWDPATEGVLFDGTPPVALANRFTSLPAFVPGDYWVGVAVQGAEEREPLGVPITLAVDVVGETDGVPPRPQGVQGPGGTPAPDGYSADEPFLVGEDTWSASVTGTAGAASGDEAAAASGGDDTRRTAGLVVGGVSLLCCAAGVALLARRRRVVPLR